MLPPLDFTTFGVFGCALGTVCLISLRFALHHGKKVAAAAQEMLLHEEMQRSMQAVRQPREEQKARKDAEEAVELAIRAVWEERHPGVPIPHTKSILAVEPAPRD